MIKHLNSLEELNEVTKSGTVIVDFFATWCGPCKMLSPVLEELDADPNFNVPIFKVDVDEVSDAAAEFNVQAIPTVILFKDGKVERTKLGFMRKDQVIDFAK